MNKKSKWQIFRHNLGVIYKRHKTRNTLTIVLVLLLIILISLFLIYQNNLKAVSKEDQDVSFTIEQGDTYMSIAPVLKEAGLIKSELFYKIYVKFHDPGELNIGIYTLNTNMSVKEIVDTLSEGSEYGAGTVIFTIPEGWYFEQIVEYTASVTNNSTDEIINAWQNEQFIDELISKYWFITEEVKNSNIRYYLEGYFFPATYYFESKDVNPNEIAYKMLDQMEVILNKYQTEINNSNYTVHQILTMASIIEHEAILDEDRQMIASVFYNRLNSDMPLQSCATLGYATGEWKLTYTYDDMQIDSPYNTYLYNGFPAGPGNMPGEASIEAALKPASSNYYYFMANVCDEEATETYYAETYEEHQANIEKYLTC